MMRFAMTMFGVGLAALAYASTVQAVPAVGKPAPDFHAIAFDGKPVQLSDFKGQVLILNFWATWCGPCKQELPLLNAYYKIDQKAGLRVLAVATEDSVPDYELRPLAKVLSFPLIHSLRGPYRQLDAVPTNYIIDRAGVVRYAKAAAFSLDDLNRLLIPLLNEPAPEPPVEQTQAATHSTR